MLIVKVLAAEPWMLPPSVKLVPSACHWQDNGSQPVAATLNATVVPPSTVWLVGWEVIIGGSSTTRVNDRLCTLLSVRLVNQTDAL